MMGCRIKWKNQQSHENIFFYTAFQFQSHLLSKIPLISSVNGQISYILYCFLFWASRFLRVFTPFLWLKNELNKLKDPFYLNPFGFSFCQYPFLSRVGVFFTQPVTSLPPLRFYHGCPLSQLLFRLLIDIFVPGCLWIWDLQNPICFLSG